MPFTSYASIGQVARKHQVRCESALFAQARPVATSNDFNAELALTLREVPYDASAEGVREALIYPLLREVWKPFRRLLTLWIRQPIAWDDDLSGTPDYLLALRSRLGHVVFEPPCRLIVVQARRDDFERGWGECLAALLAAQKINDATAGPVRGVVTNGTAWEFGLLVGNLFKRDARPHVVSPPERLTGVLHSLLLECAEQPSEQSCIAGRISP